MGGGVGASAYMGQGRRGGVKEPYCNIDLCMYC